MQLGGCGSESGTELDGGRTPAQDRSGVFDVEDYAEALVNVGERGVSDLASNACFDFGKFREHKRGGRAPATTSC